VVGGDLGDIGRESGSGREVALNVEKVLTGVKENYRKIDCDGCEALTQERARASSHPPVRGYPETNV
jgi:hypothetical protein